MRWSRARLIFATLAAPVALLLVVAAPVAAQGAAREVAQLPTELWEAAASTDGRHLYIFGGSDRAEGGDDRTRGILRYDPVNETLETMRAQLPVGRDLAAVVWTGETFLLMGGVHREGTESTRLDDVVVYDPAKDEASTSDVRLPTTLYGSEAVWFDGQAYLFGGICELEGIGRLCDTIIAVDVRSGAAGFVQARLPEPMSSPGVATDGERIYIFGGYNTERGGHNDIRWWTPDRADVIGTADTLPSSQHNPVVAWNGTEFVIAGGGSYRPVCDEDGSQCTPLLLYDEDRGVRRTAIESPAGFENSNAGAWIGDRLVMITTDRIYEIDPAYVPPAAGTPAPALPWLLVVVAVAAALARPRLG